jgi:hypothetical protein
MGGLAKAALAPVTGGASFIPGIGDAVGGFLGGAEGQNSYRAGVPNLMNTVTGDQIQNSYDRSTQALKQQKDFLAALSAQNGITNQSNVFNQLQGIAAGTGPNPAIAELNQATGQNAAQQAALMAGQRGAGANPALIARLAAQQGSAAQQNAAGTAATLQAQQSLAAQNALAGLATQQVAQQQNATLGLNQAAQSEQANILGAGANLNAARVGASNGQNAVNAQVTGANAQGKANFIGGLLGGAGSAFGLANGGEVPHFVNGGGYGLGVDIPAAVNPSGPQSNAANFILFGSANKANKMPTIASSMADTSKNNSGQDKTGQGMGKLIGIGVKALAANKGGVIKGEEYAAKGKMVPGKAKVKGDSLKNDTVNAKLSPGEIIIPRSIAQHPDAVRKSAEFVAAVLARKNKQLPVPT